MFTCSEWCNFKLKTSLAVITLSQQHDKQDVLPNSSSGFGFGIQCLTVSVYVRDQTKLIPKPKPKLKILVLVQIQVLVDCPRSDSATLF
jgi:hypothetical protein